MSEEPEAFQGKLVGFNVVVTYTQSSQIHHTYYLGAVDF